MIIGLHEKNKLILWLLVQDLVYSIYKFSEATEVGSGEKKIADTQGDQLL